MMRELMSEKVVVTSSCEVEPLRIVCTAESVEGGPGVSARATITIQDRYRFEEVYELGFGGQEMKPYFTTRWTRSAALDE